MRKTPDGVYSRVGGIERILCLPANDEADEIASAMLAQLLEHAGRATVSFPVGLIAAGVSQSLVEPIRKRFVLYFGDSTVRVLPTPGRSAAKLRTKFPRSKIVIGVWGFSGEWIRASAAFQPSPPDKFVSSLAEALEYLGFSVPVRSESFPPDDAISPKPGARFRRPPRRPVPR